MMFRVCRINAVRGFLPTTYAVFIGNYLLKIFTRKADAEKFAEECRRGAAGAVQPDKNI